MLKLSEEPMTSSLTSLPPLLSSSMLPTLNYTANVTTTHEPDPVLKAITVSICVMILFLGVVGNTLVIIVFGLKCCTDPKTYQIYVINLALADLIATIFYPSKFLHQMIGGSFELIGDTGCGALEFLGTISTIVSSFTLAIISLDRYAVVKWPLHQRSGKITVSIIIMITWMIGTMFSAWMFFIQGRVQLDGKFCAYTPTVSSIQTTTVVVALVQNGFPMALMILMNVLTIYELRYPEALLISNENFYMNRYKQNKKSVKMLIVLITVYVICVTPEKVVYLIYVYGLIPTTSLTTPGTMLSSYTMLVMLHMTNNCLNPLIYAKLHKSFRRSAMQVLCCTYQFWSDFQSTLSTSLSSKRYSEDLSLLRERRLSSLTSSRSILGSRRRSRLGSDLTTTEVVASRSPSPGPVYAFAQE